jgi:hypothetical protein
VAGDGWSVHGVSFHSNSNFVFILWVWGFVWTRSDVPCISHMSPMRAWSIPRSHNRGEAGVPSPCATCVVDFETQTLPVYRLLDEELDWWRSSLDLQFWGVTTGLPRLSQRPMLAEP